MNHRSPRAPKFDHLSQMTDARGTFEHAQFDRPRIEHGYCADDMARVLVVCTREPDPSVEVVRIAEVALRFLGDAQTLGGLCHNRMDSSGRWTDQPSVDDCWGRCVWGLGTAAAYSRQTWVRTSALIQFERAIQARARSLRASAFAALGAAELMSVGLEHRGAHKLLFDFVAALPQPVDDPAWPWPEERLTYANAVVAEAMIAAGVALELPAVTYRGLDLLAWLLDRETSGGHLSPTPVGGRGRTDRGPAFDQQPIEVSTLADACARAAAADPGPSWPEGMWSAAGWFEGVNDAGVLMYVPETGGGYDGLHADGVNQNQGAESTLAMLSTLQHAQRMALLS